MWEDRDRLRHELSYQLTARARKHLYATKRKDKDFIQPRVSEDNVYGRQLQSHTNAEESLKEGLERLEQEEKETSVAPEDKTFDKKAYDEFKKELRMRKEAKERLLSSGLPEFKAYLRF